MSNYDLKIKELNKKIEKLVGIFAAYIMEMKINGKLSDQDVVEIIKDLNAVLDPHGNK